MNMEQIIVRLQDFATLYSLRIIAALLILVIGLALQSSLANFAAGVLMIIFKPFTVDYGDVFFDTQEAIKKGFDAAGISIPFPQQDVHIIKDGTA